MKTQIVKVETKSQLRKFIDFPEVLYKGCENWVPALRGDEFDTFNPKKNPAYDFCTSECYLAMDGKKIVGRVAAIINHKCNKIWKEEVVRFGWLDFVEDIEVLKALLSTVEEFGRKHNCQVIKGPLGFTDMDKEGLLVEGYEHLSPFTCLYNYPYYDEMLNKLGFSKDVDWTQKIVKIGETLPPMLQFAEAIEKKYNIHCVRAKNMKELEKRYGIDIFHMYNEAFAPLFQFAPLTDRQIDNYLKTYIPILDRDFVAVCVDKDDNPISFAFCVPSLSKAIKKARGRLFPFGFINILKALRKNDTLEALMIGVLPEYQGKGAIIPMFKYIHQNCIKRGIHTMILNPQLEDNVRVQTLFEQYETEPFSRRRSYSKPL